MKLNGFKTAQFLGIAGATAVLVFAGSGFLSLQKGEQHLNDVTDYSIAEAREIVSSNLERVKEQHAREFAAVTSEYKLPSGDSFNLSQRFEELESQLESFNVSSIEASKTRVQTEEVVYEAGYFRGSALIQWQCSWIEEATEAATVEDVMRFKTAVANLESFKSSKDIDLFPDYEEMFADIVSPLFVGETAKAVEYIEYNCRF